MSWVIANGPGDRSSIPGRVLPKTQKIVLDAAMLNTQHYKVRIKSKVEQSREWTRALSYTLVVVIEKGAFGSPSTKVAYFTFFISTLWILHISYRYYNYFLDITITLRYYNHFMELNF